MRVPPMFASVSICRRENVPTLPPSGARKPLRPKKTPGRCPPHTKPKLVALVRLYQASGGLGFSRRLRRDANNLACAVLCLRRRFHSGAREDKSCAHERVSTHDLVMERVVEAV